MSGEDAQNINVLQRNVLQARKALWLALKDRKAPGPGEPRVIDDPNYFRMQARRAPESVAMSTTLTSTR
jgi:hypothetical protein